MHQCRTYVKSRLAPRPVLRHGVGSSSAGQNGNDRRYGQSTIESFVAMLFMCFVFMGLFQVSRLYAAREILDYAAARGARAKTVGLNRDMVWKTTRVGAIANAGLMTTPEEEVVNQDLRDALASMRLSKLWDFALKKHPAQKPHRTEIARIPEYLGSDTIGNGEAILNYEDWDTIGSRHSASTAGAATLHVEVWQNYQLRIPGHRLFVATNKVLLHAHAYLESHYTAYMYDDGL